MEKLDRFVKLGTAGEGTYGIVYKAKNKVTGKIVALKRIKLEKFYQKEGSEGIPSTTLRETTILRNLRHSSIVELLDIIHNLENLYLVFEYLDLDLKRYIDIIRKPMTKEQIRSYLKQLIDGLAYLHAQRVIHRDLKPQNLLIDREGHIKIADFGLSRIYSIPMKVYTHEVVTMWYRAPELLLGEKVYTNGIDVWSLGCVMAEMLNRKALFPGDSEIDQMFKIFQVMGTPTELLWPGVTDLSQYKVIFPQWEPVDLKTVINFHDDDEEEFLKLLLHYNPMTRKTAKQLSTEKYVKKAKLTEPDLLPFPDCDD